MRSLYNYNKWHPSVTIAHMIQRALGLNFSMEKKKRYEFWNEARPETNEKMWIVGNVVYDVNKAVFVCLFVMCLFYYWSFLTYKMHFIIFLNKEGSTQFYCTLLLLLLLLLCTVQDREPTNIVSLIKKNRIDVWTNV